MKRIESIMNAFKLDAVSEGLKRAGIRDVTITEARGLLPQGVVQTYRGVQYLVDYSPKIKIELVVSDEQLAPVLAVLEDVARAGEFGNGTIMVLPVEEMIRIQAGDRGAYTVDRGAARSSRAA